MFLCFYPFLFSNKIFGINKFICDKWEIKNSMLNESKEVWKSKILNKLYRYYIQIQGDIEKGLYKSNNYAQILNINIY